VKRWGAERPRRQRSGGKYETAIGAWEGGKGIGLIGEE